MLLKLKFSKSKLLYGERVNFLTSEVVAWRISTARTGVVAAAVAPDELVVIVALTIDTATLSGQSKLK